MQPAEMLAQLVADVESAFGAATPVADDAVSFSRSADGDAVRTEGDSEALALLRTALAACAQ